MTHFPSLKRGNWKDSPLPQACFSLFLLACTVQEESRSEVLVLVLASSLLMTVQYHTCHGGRRIGFTPGRLALDVDGGKTKVRSCYGCWSSRSPPVLYGHTSCCCSGYT